MTGLFASAGMSGTAIQKLHSRLTEADAVRLFVTDPFKPVADSMKTKVLHRVINTC
jgi:hypothetical protein